MANNKWLNDLKTLKATTNILRNTLRNKNVTAYDTDSLPTLVGKVPNLAPIEYSELEQWQPDPLWKFPDPNGSGEMKTIRQIYDEDPMATTYKYRGIYMIKGELDTMDLKAVLLNRTNADTFILSDGAVYTDVTASNLEHTWDKSKDVVDSTGIVVRYVKLYSNTVIAYVPGLYRQLIWAIHNMGTYLNASRTEYPASINYLEYDSLEVEDKVTAGKQCAAMGQPRRLRLSDKTTSNLPSDPYLMARTKWLELPNLQTFNNANLLQYAGVETLDCGNAEDTLALDIGGMANLKRIIYPQSLITVNITNSACVRGSSSNRIVPNRDLVITIPYGVITATFYDLHQHEIYLPKSLKTLQLYYCYMKSLILPDNITSVSLNSIGNLERLDIPSSVTSLTFNNCWSITELVLPQDFTVAINLKTCHSLTHDSLVDILNKLADLTGQPSKKLTLGTAHLAKLSDEEKLIATNKNWTLA